MGGGNYATLAFWVELIYNCNYERKSSWVASKFNFSRRRENLFWSLHLEVAGLEPEQMESDEEYNNRYRYYLYGKPLPERAKKITDAQIVKKILARSNFRRLDHFERMGLIKIYPNRLEFSEDVTFEQWVCIGEALGMGQAWKRLALTDN